ncbi:MAG: hypothetical protein LW595_03700 [Rickettsiales bacterium]|nr:hypothetical protein [Rickettsiales bacterium]
MPNFFKNFHNFYKEFGSYISIFEKVPWDWFLVVVLIVCSYLEKNLIVVVVIFCFIFALKSRSKKIADKQREEEEREKQILSNLSETRKEVLKFLSNDTLKEILKDDDQIEKLANGRFDKNKLLFTYKTPLRFYLSCSHSCSQLSFAQRFDGLVPENTKKINIKFNVVEINVVEKKSNNPVEFEVFIRDGNQDKKLDNRDKEYEFDYHQGEELRFYFENLEEKLGCYYEFYFAIQSITFRDPLKSS